jgi:hypothetical protein
MRSIYLIISGVERGKTYCLDVHMRFGDVLDDYWDIVVPSTYRLVVGGGYETTILIDESNSIHRSKMLIVSLDDLVRS